MSTLRVVDLEQPRPGYAPVEPFSVPLDQGERVVSVETITDAFGVRTIRVWIATEDAVTLEHHDVKATDDAVSRGVVSVIRRLGFIGNTHYCSDCGNEFHADRGQHKPDCGLLAGKLADDDWFEAWPWLPEEDEKE